MNRTAIVEPRGLRSLVQPLRGEASDFDAVLSAAGEKRYVLIGEATHGTHEFYRVRAEITKRLIRERGFAAVAIEGDWPDAHRVHRFDASPARSPKRSRAASSQSTRMRGSSLDRSAVTIPARNAGLNADLTIPSNATGLVLFVHGSGSSRLSSRNRFVAEVLNEGGFATLLADLLTQGEARKDARTGEFRFDIGLLADRTVAMIDWALGKSTTSPLPIGLFGASTGAAAAVIAATRRPKETRTVVSRGGRVDLAGKALTTLRAPLLMLVGALDYPLLELHQRAIPLLRCEHSYVVIPGATHLFEEPGALERVAALAAQWFSHVVCDPEGIRTRGEDLGLVRSPPIAGCR